MTDQPRHYDDELQEALDGRLDRAAQLEVDAHVSTCAPCRARLEALREGRASLARVRDEAVPPDLAASVLAAVRAEPIPVVGVDGRRRRKTAVPAWTWALATAAVFAIVAWMAWPRPDVPLTEAAAADYRAYRDGRLALDVQSANVAEVEAFFRRSGLGIETRVFDLAMMQFIVEGGRAHRLGARPSALFVYRGSDGRRLVCQMFRGRTDELPTPVARRVHDDIEFLVFDEGGVTLVFWQEGDVVCVLAGEGAAEDVIQLAFAKAVKV